MSAFEDESSTGFAATGENDVYDIILIRAPGRSTKGVIRLMDSRAPFDSRGSVGTPDTFETTSLGRQNRENF